MGSGASVYISTSANSPPEFGEAPEIPVVSRLIRKEYRGVGRKPDGGGGLSGYCSEAAGAAGHRRSVTQPVG